MREGRETRALFVSAVHENDKSEIVLSIKDGKGDGAHSIGEKGNQ